MRIDWPLQLDPMFLRKKASLDYLANVPLGSLFDFTVIRMLGSYIVRMSKSHGNQHHHPAKSNRGANAPDETHINAKNLMHFRLDRLCYLQGPFRNRLEVILLLTADRAQRWGSQGFQRNAKPASL